VKKLIIEARINEMAKKGDNPNVAYTPEEIAADAIACAEAGAAVVHFHARNPDGSESSRVEDYRAAVTAIRARSDVLIHTTLGRFQGAAADERLSHIEALAGNADERPDIAPLDMGSNNIDFWDPQAKAFIRHGAVYLNTTPDLKQMAERLKAWGVKPQTSLWTVANARLMGAFVESGLIAEPVYAVCYLAGDGFLAGHPASSAGLRAFVENLPPARVEWSVLGLQTDLTRLVPEIVALGGHVSIGLGDHPYAELGRPSNPDLVRQVAEMARAAGRDVATPQEARAMLFG
jgi:3-keto-5-aminohexanoate cleavage enzyme